MTDREEQSGSLIRGQSRDTREADHRFENREITDDGDKEQMSRPDELDQTEQLLDKENIKDREEQSDSVTRMEANKVITEESIHSSVDDDEIWELGNVTYTEIGETNQVNKKTKEDKDPALTYADDIMSIKVRQTLLYLKQAIEKTYNKLKAYCDINRLKLNSDKTHFLLIKSNQRRRGGEDQTVKLDTDWVKESQQEQVLGLKVNRSELDWSSHLDKVLRDCAKKFSALKLGGKFSNFKQRL